MSEITEITQEARRLRIVHHDSGLSLRDFAKLFGLSHASLSRILNGTQPMPLNLVKYVTNELGYSARWFITGEGSRKAKGKKDPNPDIQMLRVELDIMSNRVKMLESTIKIQEQIMKDNTEEFKHLIEFVKNIANYDPVKKQMKEKIK